MGMSANGAQVGLSTMHYYWIGAIPAMLFLGVVMMPFYYGSRVAQRARVHAATLRPRCPPGQRDQLRHRPGAHRRRQPVPAGDGDQGAARLAAVGVADRRGASWCSATSRSVGLSAAIYNEVLQFFVILAALVPLTIFGLIRVGGWDGA